MAEEAVRRAGGEVSRRARRRSPRRELADLGPKSSKNISRWRAAASSAAPICARPAICKLVPVFWEIGVVGVEIALDEETGKISLDSLVTIGDVGLAIHPAMTESQDLGAATMGMGVGLFEELIYDGQQLMNGTMLEYRVPRFSDLAATLR